MIANKNNRVHTLRIAFGALFVILFLVSGAEAATEIGACTTISTSGEYVLNTSISNNANSICININASDVIFDGAGYTIDGVRSTNTYGVYVYNSATTLTNVTVQNLTVTDWHYGIYYYETNLGIIQNITANSNTFYGIYLKNSTLSTISGTNATSNDIDGINLQSSSNNTLSNNTANSNTRYGIYLTTSSNNNLTNNTASSSNNIGIFITSSSSNTFTNNTATANVQVGIYLDSSNNGTLTSNNASSNSGTGMLFSGSSSNTLTSNTANDNDYGIKLSGSSNNNTFVDNTFRRNANRGFEIVSGSNNNTLRNNTMDFNLIGVFLSNGAEYNLVDRNNIYSNTESGIREDDKSYNTYSNNTLIGNSDYGIRLFDTHDDTISNNTISGSNYGIYLSSSYSNIIEGNNLSNNNVAIYLISSNNNNILENKANSNNWYGILITSSINNILTNNTATSNTQYGIYLSSSNSNNLTSNNANLNQRGIYIISSNSSILTDNTATSNSIAGIYINSSSNNTVTSNTANSNTNYGFYLTSSDNNTLTSNTALNNSLWDFYSTTNSLNNTVTNLYINSTISFTSKDIAIRGVTAPASDPSGYRNISKFVNATNNSVDSWLFLNVSYSDDDISGLNESSLKVWEYNGTAWSQLSGTNGVNTASNYAFANITNFSTFALFGTALPSSHTGGGSDSIGGILLILSEPRNNVVDYERVSNYLGKNTSNTYSFNFENGVYLIMLNGGNTNNDVTMGIEILNGPSQNVPILPPGVVYMNLNILSSTKDIKEAIIKFKVDNKWLKDNDFDASEMKLVKYNGNEWITLDTKVIGTKDQWMYFEAKVNSFSPFAIVGIRSVPAQEAQVTITNTAMIPAPREEVMTETTQIPSAEPMRNTPGFEIVLAVAAILTVFIFSKRR